MCLWVTCSMACKNRVSRAKCWMMVKEVDMHWVVRVSPSVLVSLSVSLWIKSYSQQSRSMCFWSGWLSMAISVADSCLPAHESVWTVQLSPRCLFPRQLWREASCPCCTLWGDLFQETRAPACRGLMPVHLRCVQINICWQDFQVGEVRKLIMSLWMTSIHLIYKKQNNWKWRWGDTD